MPCRSLLAKAHSCNQRLVRARLPVRAHADRLDDAVAAHPPVPFTASRGHVHLVPGNTRSEDMAAASLPVPARQTGPRLFPLRFPSVGPPCLRALTHRQAVSSSLPPPDRLPCRSWLRVVVLSRFHVRSSCRGRAPHLQRARAGRTQRPAHAFANPRLVGKTERPDVRRQKSEEERNNWN